MNLGDKFHDWSLRTSAIRPFWSLPPTRIRSNCTLAGRDRQGGDRLAAQATLRANQRRVAAQLIATTPSHALFGRALSQLHREHLAQARYAQRLNWLLFNGFQPQDMWNVFEHFYRLPDQLIHRFHALALTASNRARILVGKPPAGFQLGTALRSTSSQLGRSLQAALARTR
jgi:hypothetical protein